MQTYDAISILSALGQIARLEAFRALLQREPDGMTENELLSAIGIGGDALAEHLSVLIGAGLVSTQHVAHDIVYRAQPARLRELNVYFVRDFQGRFEHCARLVADVVNQADAARTP